MIDCTSIPFPCSNLNLPWRDLRPRLEELDRQSAKSNPSSLPNPCCDQERLPRATAGLQKEEMLDHLQITNYKAQQEREGDDDEKLSVHDSSSPISHIDSATLLVSLAACCKSKDLRSGIRLHKEIVLSGIDKENVQVGNTLINMYAKCGDLEKAREVFDELYVRNTVSWNCLISGYVQHGQGEEALRCFEGMQLGGFSPNTITLVSILKVYGSPKKLQELHVWIIKNGLLQNDTLVKTGLVDAYAKCGLLGKAREVFDELQERDVVSWTALIMGYALHGYGKEALGCFIQMQHEGLSPNAITFVGISKACGCIGSLKKGLELHARALNKSRESHILVMNSLLDMYAKCNDLEMVRQVFDDLPTRDRITWTTLLTGQVQNGQYEEAIDYFGRMLNAGYSPDSATFFAMFKACGNSGAIDKGQEVHARAVKDGLVEDLHVGTAVVGMYADCGMLSKAQVVFNEFEAQDGVMWNALISGYAKHEDNEEALKCFEMMQLQGFLADVVTLNSLLMVYSSKRALLKGHELHSLIVKIGLFEGDSFVCTGLMDMYVHCSRLAEAQQVFDRLPIQDVIAWNVLIGGYFEHGHGDKALNLLETLQLRGLCPNASTFVWALKACGNLGAVDKGQELHAKIVRDELRDVTVDTMLVDMYVKFGLFEEAQDAFEELQEQDLVSWNVLIAGYAQHGHEEEAFHCIERMERLGLSPDASSCASILKCCRNIGAASRGQQLHIYSVNAGWLEEGIAVGTVLVDMYANSGMLMEAHNVFDKLPYKDVVSWNALLAGYAQYGEENFVFRLFDEMLQEGTWPTVATFSSVLNVCSHRGLLYFGQTYFRMISEAYGIFPTIEHHTCIVDLFGRAGHLHKAAAVTEEMPFLSNFTSWLTVLDACQKCGDTKLGRWAFGNAVLADRKNAAAYICMSNIYSML